MIFFPASLRTSYYNLIDAAWLVDWLIVMGVCSVSEDSKEARPHYGVPHTKEFLPGKTELHGLCFVGLRCERTRTQSTVLPCWKEFPTHTWDHVHAAGPYQDPKLLVCKSDCESSGGSSSSAAAHPSPLMSTRGRELSLHLRQQRLQLLNSSDGSFNYIPAAKAAKAANHMVCKTLSSIFNSESVVVLYRGGPI